MKRIFDIIIVLLLIICLTPLMIWVGILIKFEDGGAILFLQSRPGEFGRIFRIYKFRSFRNTPCGESSEKTRMGSWLRNWKLDELPQLFNVLRGEMTLSGPRPCTLEDHSKFDSKRTLIRYAAKPGMTGLWQSNRSNRISLKSKLRLDAWYALHPSTLRDFLICLKTIWILTQGAGDQTEQDQSLNCSVHIARDLAY